MLTCKSKMSKKWKSRIKTVVWICLNFWYVVLTIWRGGYRIYIQGCTLLSQYALRMRSNKHFQDLCDFGTTESDTFEINPFPCTYQ